MAEQLDVYRDWLGITETARPLNYYQLLRLKTFEDDAAKIPAHYRKIHAHVRKFATGEHAGAAQDLLGELARAMLCLTDAQRKREYDASLGRREEGVGRRRGLEEILLANKVIDQEQLDRARRFADQVGLEIRDAILQQKLAPPDQVMLAYAESEGLPYIELDDVGVDEQLVPQIPPLTARQHSCVPIMADSGRVLMASPNPLVPDVEEDLRLRLGMPVRTVLCTPISVNQAITKYYPRDAPAFVAPAAPAKPAAAAPAAPPPPPPPEKKPLTKEESIKERTKIAVIAFNVVFILYMIYRALGGLDVSGYVGAAVVAALLGLVSAGVAFGIMTLLQK
jgi:hypothetical protein